MQKKIIALAVAGLMSGAAFAQSNVTISGVLDAGLASVKADAVTGGATENAAYNGSATSSVWIKAQEDLGNGMKAGMGLETQPFATAAAGGTSLGQIQHYVWIGGNFGTVSAGKKNTLTLKSLTTIQPFGTTLAGGYGNALTADTRHEGVVAYDSPDFNGLTFGVMFKPKNSNHTPATSNAYGYQNLGVNYGAGPLNVTFAYAKEETPNGATTSAGTAVTSDTDRKINVLGANYTFGAFTVYAGMETAKQNDATGTTLNVSTKNVALKWMATSNISLAANYVRGNDKTVNNADDKLWGLGADYMMSKRTAAYFRYENRDLDKNTSGALGQKTRTYAVGLRHAF